MVQERLFDVDVIDQVLEQQASDPSLIYLEKGTILRARKIPQMIFTEITRRMEMPKIPRVEHPSERGRYIDNPDDPDYIKAVKKFNEDQGLALTDVLLGLGTILVSVGTDQYAPEQEEWLEEVVGFLPDGVKIPDTSKGRYLAWLKFYQVLGGNDLQKIVSKVTGLMGVSEAEVGLALNSFRSDERQQADLPSGDQA